MSIKEVIRAILKTELKPQTVLAKVINVNDDLTIDVEVPGSPSRFSVRVRSVVADDSGVLIMPKLNSFVLVSLIENNIQSSYVTAFSEVDYVTVKIGNSSFRIDESEINGQVSNTKMIIDAEGVKIAKGTESLNKILNDTCSACQNITVTAPSGVTSTPINTAVFAAIKTRINSLIKA